jgi:hypothetical protein
MRTVQRAVAKRRRRSNRMASLSLQTPRLRTALVVAVARRMQQRRKRRNRAEAPIIRLIRIPLSLTLQPLPTVCPASMTTAVLLLPLLLPRLLSAIVPPSTWQPV